MVKCIGEKFHETFRLINVRLHFLPFKLTPCCQPANPFMIHLKGHRSALPDVSILIIENWRVRFSYGQPFESLRYLISTQVDLSLKVPQCHSIAIFKHPKNHINIIFIRKCTTAKIAMDMIILMA